MPDSRTLRLPATFAVRVFGGAGQIQTPLPQRSQRKIAKVAKKALGQGWHCSPAYNDSNAGLAYSTESRSGRLHSLSATGGISRENCAREAPRLLDWEYWGKPVPGFGDPNARVLVLGLAPGAHGSNRTGRPFTGDASGKFMYPILYEAGFSNQPDATKRDDGLELRDLYITAAVRCAPPDNKPLPRGIGQLRPLS